MDGWERGVQPRGDGRQPARQVSPCQLPASHDDAKKGVALSFAAGGRGGRGQCEARVAMQGKPEEQIRGIKDKLWSGSPDYPSVIGSPGLASGCEPVNLQ